MMSWTANLRHGLFPCLWAVIHLDENSDTGEEKKNNLAGPLTELNKSGCGYKTSEKFHSF